jgi:transcriptional regulator with XRE-family HTH domain
MNLRGFTDRQLAEKCGLDLISGATQIRAIECNCRGNINKELWEKLRNALNIPKEEVMAADFTAHQHSLRNQVLQESDKGLSLGKFKYSSSMNASENILVNPVEIFSLQDIIDRLLKNLDSIKSISAKLGISERQFQRRYQKERRAMLSFETYSKLSMSGFPDSMIAFAHGYTRQSLWARKKEWGLQVNEEVVSRKQSSHFRKGLPPLETVWGPAYEYRRGYYMVRINKESPYWGHPIAPNHQCLLHRIIVFENLMDNDPKSEFLFKEKGHITLHPQCQVHHKNGDTSDNRLENLLLTWKASHIKKHWHGTAEMREAFLKEVENKGDLTKNEILEIIKKYYD